KSRPYLGFNLVLAQTMGWVVKKEDGSYAVGPNLLMHPLLSQPKNPKVAASADKNQLMSFTDYVKVHRGMVYLAMVVDWQFVNLDEAYARATTHVFVPPKATRPVHLYCNVGESSIVGTQITNFLRDLPYKDQPIRWEPEHVQYHRVRGDTVEILEVEVAETNGQLLTLNPAGETQVTLHFQA
ncbi:unnamed protein product, partial [Porites evermanni]